VTIDAVGAGRETPTTRDGAGRKRDNLSRLTKVEGQVRGVARMVEGDVTASTS